MNKCIKCGDIINSDFEICYDCKNSSDEKIKIKIDNDKINQVKRKSSKEFYYKLYNLFFIPLSLVLIGGATQLGVKFYPFNDISLDTFGDISQFIGFGYGALLIGYYPIKLIVLFVNRYKKNKWEWPIGYSYFILPLIIIMLNW